MSDSMSDARLDEIAGMADTLQWARDADAGDAMREMRAEIDRLRAEQLKKTYEITNLRGQLSGLHAAAHSYLTAPDRERPDKKRGLLTAVTATEHVAIEHNAQIVEEVQGQLAVLRASCLVLDNGKRFCRVCRRSAYPDERIEHEVGCAVADTVNASRAYTIQVAKKAGLHITNVAANARAKALLEAARAAFKHAMGTLNEVFVGQTDQHAVYRAKLSKRLLPSHIVPPEEGTLAEMILEAEARAFNDK